MGLRRQYASDVENRKEGEMNTYLLAAIIVGLLGAFGLYLAKKGHRE